MLGLWLGRALCLRNKSQGNVVSRAWFKVVVGLVGTRY